MTTEPVALVTGTSSGMGLWTAVGLAQRGLHVVATMRDVGRADRLRAAATDAGVEVDVRALDVTDRAGTAACLDGIRADLGEIEVLVNNAGRGSVGTLEQIDDATLQQQLDVNYLGVAALTRAVLPGMRTLGRGRIVTVTSVGGAVGQPFADAYCGAKFAVEGLMQSLAPVVARFGIGVAVVEPAAVASDFVTNADVQDRSGVEGDPYGELRAAYLKRSGAAFANAQDARGAAAIIVEAATTSDPKFRWQTSPGASAFVGMSLADLDGSAVLGQTATWIV
ncbi:MAG: SDR family NAD(P)-dependent oxidoreductase [Actinomycetota bacterium]|nr:SDR family NAD(P)-dependent oxidoreductase [Actinomycetota bacterium]